MKRKTDYPKRTNWKPKIKSNSATLSSILCDDENSEKVEEVI